MPERRITILTPYRTTGFRIMSQILIEAGLTKYGRSPDIIPMRPHSPSHIAKLGRALDRAERSLDQMIEFDDLSDTTQATIRRRGLCSCRFRKVVAGKSRARPEEQRQEQA
jgi:hypothetical protein